MISAIKNEERVKRTGNHGWHHIGGRWQTDAYFSLKINSKSLLYIHIILCVFSCKNKLYFWTEKHFKRWYFSSKITPFKLALLVFFVFCQRNPFSRARALTKPQNGTKTTIPCALWSGVKIEKKHAVKEQWIEGLRNRELLFIGIKLALYGVRRKSPSSNDWGGERRKKERVSKMWAPLPTKTFRQFSNFARERYHLVNENTWPSTLPKRTTTCHSTFHCYRFVNAPHIRDENERK